MNKKKLPIQAIQKAAECLRIISHPARLQIIQYLSEGERSVGEIADECELAPHVTSTHLKLLERCGMLKHTRHGKSVHYKIIEKHLFDLLRCIERRFG
jgi:DNA-binding transcriptional ArsR family regulator